jgi:hypothetical protein
MLYNHPRFFSIFPIENMIPLTGTHYLNSVYSHINVRIFGEKETVEILLLFSQALKQSHLQSVHPKLPASLPRKMSSYIINLIREIKAGRPMGIVKNVTPTRQVDIGTFTQKVAEMAPIDNNRKLVLPLSAAAASQVSKANVVDHLDRLSNHHIEEIRKRMVPNPAYKVYLEEQAKKGTKRKADDELESSELHAENVAVLNQITNDKVSKTAPSVKTVINNGARKKARTKKARTKKA